MTEYLSAMDWATGLVPFSGLLGVDLAPEYNVASPFPHIAIDNFLPYCVAHRLLSEFPEDRKADNFDDRAQERRKRQIVPENLDSWSRQVFYSFNSAPFIRVIENITGIIGLVPDPHFLGGGYHEIQTGGYLSMHADFNHHKRMNLERRVNVLIYLNEGWREEFGGQLELWNSDMTKRVKSYVPTFNRCVIFNTTSDSMHGNPNPVRHPGNMPRRSIALYYYTATWSDAKRSHTTKFKQRPGSNDKFDLKLAAQELVKDCLPPLVFRQLCKFKK